MAKIILETNNIFSIGPNASDSTVYGAAGTEKVILAAGSYASIDQNVERTELSGASSSYTYAIAGNKIIVSSGSKAVATIIGGNGNKTIAFSDGSAILALTGLNKATLGGKTISTTASALTGVTLNTSDISTIAAQENTATAKALTDILAGTGFNSITDLIADRTRLLNQLTPPTFTMEAVNSNFKEGEVAAFKVNLLNRSTGDYSVLTSLTGTVATPGVNFDNSLTLDPASITAGITFNPVTGILLIPAKSQLTTATLSTATKKDLISPELGEKVNLELFQYSHDAIGMPIVEIIANVSVEIKDVPISQTYSKTEGIKTTTYDSTENVLFVTIDATGLTGFFDNTTGLTSYKVDTSSTKLIKGIGNAVVAIETNYYLNNSKDLVKYSIANTYSYTDKKSIVHDIASNETYDLKNNLLKNIWSNTYKNANGVITGIDEYLNTYTYDNNGNQITSSEIVTNYDSQHIITNSNESITTATYDINSNLLSSKNNYTSYDNQHLIISRNESINTNNYDEISNSVISSEINTNYEYIENVIIGSSETTSTYIYDINYDVLYNKNSFTIYDYQHVITESSESIGRYIYDAFRHILIYSEITTYYGAKHIITGYNEVLKTNTYDVYGHQSTNSRVSTNYDAKHVKIGSSENLDTYIYDASGKQLSHTQTNTDYDDLGKIKFSYFETNDFINHAISGGNTNFDSNGVKMGSSTYVENQATYDSNSRALTSLRTTTQFDAQDNKINSEEVLNTITYDANGNKLGNTQTNTNYNSAGKIVSSDYVIFDLTLPIKIRIIGGGSTSYDANGEKTGSSNYVKNQATYDANGRSLTSLITRTQFDAQDNKISSEEELNTNTYDANGHSLTSLITRTQIDAQDNKISSNELLNTYTYNVDGHQSTNSQVSTNYDAKHVKIGSTKYDTIFSYDSIGRQSFKEIGIRYDANDTKLYTSISEYDVNHNLISNFRIAGIKIVNYELTGNVLNINGFNAGDQLNFSSSFIPIITNSTKTDGFIDVICNSTTIHLTGLTLAQDQAVNDITSFNNVFGNGALGSIDVNYLLIM